jgi:hypothetical protein
MKPFLSNKSGQVYWKGMIDLVNDTSISMAVLEIVDHGIPQYRVYFDNEETKLDKIIEQYKQKQFKSARMAIQSFERDVNKEIYNQK